MSNEGAFRDDQGIQYAGIHVIVDMWGGEYLTDQDYIERALKDAVDQSGATLLHIYLHPFEGGGVSGVAVLAESHISVHTWPEENYAAFDVFMCGKAKPQEAVRVLKEWFRPSRVVVGSLKRGMVS